MTTTNAGNRASPALDLKAETAKVQRELTAFRTTYLPALFGQPIAEVLPDFMPETIRFLVVEIAGRLSPWQGAVSRLAEALPFDLDGRSLVPLNREAFAECMFQQTTPGWSIRAGVIVWKIGLGDLMEVAWHWYRKLFAWPEDLEAARRQFPSTVAAVRPWLMRQPVDHSGLWNALCVLVPLLADEDPGFAKLALDPETWRAIVRANQSLTVEQREQQLAVIDRGYLGHVLNNALLHVLGALANNHFLEITDFLDHPHLLGGYTGLMPHYLFAVLFEKVTTLRRLAGVAPDEGSLEPYN
jgi:hypothetical protein